VNSPDARALLLQARSKLAALPERSERVRTCEPVEPERNDDVYPVRLRIR
jgi:hypothetical protein